MSGPSLATIKRLFATSGNLCAFAHCQQELVVGTTVVGEVCHISAASAGGPRFDAQMSEQDRASFDNLILMCPTHHKIVDSEPGRFTVEQLIELKRRQIERPQGNVTISDEVAQTIAASLVGATIVNSVLSINQSGGQTAHTIQNFGPPKRSISHEQRRQMVAALRASPSTIGFASTQGDVEADSFKRQLMEVFREAGWTVLDRWTFMFFGARTGIVLTIPFGAPEHGPVQVAASALALTGNPVAGNHGDMAKECGIYVQVWHSPLQ